MDEEEENLRTGLVAVTISTAHERKGGLSLLPDEVLDLVLDRVPIVDLFASCQRVNHHWRDLCSRAVRRRKSLSLCSTYGHREQEDIIIRSGSDPMSVRQSLLALVSLTSIRAGHLDEVTFTNGLQSLIHLSATHLTTLICPYHDIGIGLHFQSLRVLNCHSLCPDSLIRIQGEKELIRMEVQSFDRETTDVTVVLTKVLSFRNLRHLKLGSLFLTDQKIRKSYGLLFSNFTDLRSIDLSKYDEDTGEDDVLMDSLVTRNSGLQIIHMSGMSITDRTFASLSRLHNLMSVRLINGGSALSADGLVLLMRGSGRQRLSEILVYQRNKFLVDTIRAECDLMSQESGRRLQFRPLRQDRALDITLF